MSNNVRKIPLLDESIPLNCNMIAEILGLFLKCNPQVNFVYLPEFRLVELRKFARTLSGKKEINEANVFEAIGSLYCLCAYYGGTSGYGSESEFLKNISEIQTILTECIFSMKWSGIVSLIHPDDRINNLKLSGEKIKQHLITTFQTSNDIIKDIIRDVIRQIRICREKGNSKTKSKQPIDCLLLHSVYIMCTYCLAHVTAIRHHQGNLDITPGLYESLICILHIDTIRDPIKVKLIERIRKSKKQSLGDTDRFDICISLARHLAYVVIRKIDITYVNKLRIFRGRLSRYGTTSNPKIEFAKLKSQIIKTQLLQSSPIQETNLPNKKSSVPNIADLLPGAEEKTESITTEVSNDVLFKKLILSERSISADNCILNVGIQPPESLIIALSDHHADEAAPLTLGDRDGFTTRTDSYSEDLTHQNTEKSADDEDDSNLKEFKEITEIMKLSLPLRSYYLLSRPLREFKLIFENEDDESHIIHINEACSAFELTLRRMDKAYRNCLKRPIPRFLNQEEGMYWMCDLYIEHIYQEISNGNIFLDINQQHITSLQVKLKKETLDIKKCREEGFKTMTISKYISFQTKTHDNNNNNNNNNNNQLSNTTSQIKISKKVVKKLDVVERLNLARKEAILERKLDQLKLETDNQIKNQAVLKAQQLLENLPIISKLNSSTIPQTPNLKQTSSLPLFGNDQLNSKQGSFFTDVNSNNLDGKYLQKSIIWTATPELEDEHELRKRKEKKESEKRNKLLREQNFEGIPKKFGLEYAKSIKAQQEERRLQEEQFKLEMKDLQEVEVTRLQARQQLELKEKKEAEKKEINDSLNYKKILDDQKREIRKKRIADRKLEEKRRAEMEEQEAEKIRDLKSWAKFRQDREERLKKERHLMERVRLKNMASAKEYEEILRSHKEEMRMKYLEEIQRAKELKRFEAERQKKVELMQKQRKVKEEREIILARIRKGNFMYHHGKLGYYDNIRDEQLPYIQYEDDQGYPYYFDPITLQTTYVLPPNVPVIHHTEKERQEYDRLYGEGAYDILQADKKWKEQCNIDGGYWENGTWIQLKGYYDENYEFISFY